MTTLNFPDLAKKIGVDQDETGAVDWSRTLQRCLMTGTKPGETPLIPNGHYLDPTIVRIPELYHGVSSIEPYRDARHIQIGDDPETGFHFSTLGVGNVNAEQSIYDAIPDDPTDPAQVKAAKLNADKLMAWRGRFGLGPVGGYGWKFQGILKGPKLPGMPWRSPSGTTSKTRNALEGQAAFRPKDFYGTGDVNGWEILPGSDFGWWWGDAISPSVSPRAKPAEGLYVAGVHMHDLGRMGVLISNVRGWHVTWSTFGNGIPSDLFHSETGTQPNRVIGDGLADYCVIQSGKRTLHANGGSMLQSVTIDRVVRRDRQHAVYLDGRPELEGGRIRGIRFVNNTHDRYIDGERLGVYRGCSLVAHTGNRGPVSKRYTNKDGTLNLSSTLFAEPSTGCGLAPNRYWGPKGER